MYRVSAVFKILHFYLKKGKDRVEKKDNTLKLEKKAIQLEAYTSSRKSTRHISLSSQVTAFSMLAQLQDLGLSLHIES